MAQKPQARAAFPPVEILGSLNAGLDGYSDPTTTTPKKWFASNNVFSGLFAFIQRARFANVIVGQTPVQIGSVNYNFTTGLVTVNTLLAHSFSNGQQVNITGVPIAPSSSYPGVDGYYIITVVASQVFTYTISTALGGPVSFTTFGTAASIAYVLYPSSLTQFTTFKYYAIPGLSSYLLADANGKLFSFDAGNNYTLAARLNPFIDPSGAGTPLLNGPWSREALENISYEMNGQVKQTGRAAFGAVIETFGLDSPDVSPQIVINAGSSQTITNIQRSNGTVTVTLGGALTVPGGNGIGMINANITVGDTSFAGTFVVLTGSGTATLTWAQLGQNTTLLTPTGTVDVNITKSVGRSYAYAWENANKPHVSAPSPSSQFILYNGQNGIIQLIEQGTVTATLNSTTLVGNGTAFTSAWIGRWIWIQSGTTNGLIQITAVASPTSLTMSQPWLNVTTSGLVFQVADIGITHVRLYETADGGATYFRTQRNAVNFTSNSANSTLATTGFQFFDNGNSEPPNFPFTTETSQLNNLPPPIGSFIAEYQGVLIVFGVPGALQSFFYSNQTLTTIGLLQESFAPLNQYTLPIQNAQLRGWQEMPGAALIWSDRQDMFRLTGLLTDNTAATAPQQGAQISRLPYNLGIANPYAVDLTPLGAIWVTPQAEVWLYNDQYAPRNIGRSIQNVLNSIAFSAMSNIRCKYYHNNTRNWFIISCATSGSSTNNTLLILDLDMLSSNGSPSFFVFDMAANQPSWWQFTASCTSIETMYEPSNLVRLLVGGTDLIEDVDYSNGFGTEISVTNPFVLFHPFGNESAAMIKRPTFLRFNTNRDPSQLAGDGWSFAALGIDDDFYTFAFPLTQTFTPGVNDTVTLGGNPNLAQFGSPFRTSAELFRVGGVNFVQGRRIQFQVNFPTRPGANYQLRQIQVGFAPSPPR